MCDGREEGEALHSSGCFLLLLLLLLQGGRWRWRRRRDGGEEEVFTSGEDPAFRLGGAGAVDPDCGERGCWMGVWWW